MKIIIKDLLGVTKGLQAFKKDKVNISVNP